MKHIYESADKIAVEAEIRCCKAIRALGSTTKERLRESVKALGNLARLRASRTAKIALDYKISQDKQQCGPKKRK